MKAIRSIGASVLLAAATLSPAYAQDHQQLFLQALDTIHAVPGNPPARMNQTQLAWYAWRLFAAMNQGTRATVQNGSAREVPAIPFRETGRRPGPLPSPTIFEALYHRTEAYPWYPRGTRPPSPLGRPPVYRFSPIEGTPYTVTGGQYVNLDETNQIGQNFIYYRLSRDPNFPILFMAKVDRNVVQYAQVPGRIQPTDQRSWVFPDNTLEIKSAWRRVSDIRHSDPNRYHLARATWYEGVEGEIPTARTDVFALIGLHIIQKSANYKQFIFTTFEHVDAVTRDPSGTAIIDPRYELTYNTLKYGPGEPTTPTASFQGAYVVNRAGLPPALNRITPGFPLPPAGVAPNTHLPPSCIENAPYMDAAGNVLNRKFKCAFQPRVITREVNDVNNQVNAALSGTVWQNYRLKGVQAVATSNQVTPDYYLANIVVETSQPGVQLFHGGVSGTGTSVFTNTRSELNITTRPLAYNRPVPPANANMGGCMGCHGVAQTVLGTDFSFLPPSPQLSAGKPVDSVPPANVSAAALAAHERAMAAKKVYLFSLEK